MKYSLSSRQLASYLEMADEIKVQFRDRQIIPDLVEEYPGTTINLVHHYKDSEIDWKDICNLNILSKGRMILGLSSINDIYNARDYGLKYYYLAPAYSFQQLSDYKNLGVCCVILGAPLFFQMSKVARFNIPVRVIANIANATNEIPQKDGVLGTWIRPEDVKIYEPYVDTIEFYGNRQQEQALFRIYTQTHEWSGELSMLVPDLNYKCTNRMIPPSLAKRRLNCGQRCKENGVCQLCYRTLDLANPERLRKIRDSQNVI